jgi:hypothetical protein
MSLRQQSKGDRQQSKGDNPETYWFRSINDAAEFEFEFLV